MVGWNAIRNVVSNAHREFCGGCPDDHDQSIDAETQELWEAARND